MKYTERRCKIDADSEYIYSLLKDITMWPKVFQPCQKAEIISTQEHSELVKLTAKTKNKFFSWTSRRIFHDQDKIVEFEQIETAFMIKRMKGKWSINSLERGSEIVLSHWFEVNSRICKRFVTYIAERFFIDANSKKELEGLKTFCEKVETMARM